MFFRITIYGISNETFSSRFSHFRGPRLADSNFGHASSRYVFFDDGRDVGKAERQRECQES